MRGTALLDRTYELLARSKLLVRAGLHAHGVGMAIAGKRLAPNTLASQNGEYKFLWQLRGGARVVVDVGAHVGDWTAAVLDRWSDLERAVCYEPVDWAARQTERRFAWNDGIEVVRRVLSDHPGALTFWAEPVGLTVRGAGQEGATMSSAVRGHSAPATAAQQLDATTLDAELDRLAIDHVDILKIDAEGFDLQVMRGAGEALAAGSIEVVQFEYTPAWQVAGSTLFEACDLLECAGHRVFVITPSGLRTFDVAEVAGLRVYANFVSLAPMRAQWFENVPAVW